MNLSEDSLVVWSRDQLSCELDREIAILNLTNQTYFGLNRVATVIWNALREPRRIGELRDLLLERYEVDHERCLTDVIKLVGELHHNGLVEIRQ
jgi:hypothetical protein